MDKPRKRRSFLTSRASSESDTDLAAPDDLDNEAEYLHVDECPPFSALRELLIADVASMANSVDAEAPVPTVAPVTNGGSQSASGQVKWTFNKTDAPAYARAVTRRRVKDRGVMETVRKIEASDIIPDDQSQGTQQFRMCLREAKEKNSALHLLKAYTIDCFFYRILNREMSTGSSKKVFKKLHHGWTGYYTGSLMGDPSLEPYRVVGKTFRGVPMDKDEFQKKYQVGKLWTNKSFQSTSRLPSVAKRFMGKPPTSPGIVRVLTAYIIHDRTAALDIHTISAFPEEAEVLMLPGRLFRITAVSDTEDPIRVIVEQVLTDDA